MHRLIDAPGSDHFNMLAYIRFSNPSKICRERAEAEEDGGLHAAMGECETSCWASLKPMPPKAK